MPVPNPGKLAVMAAALVLAVSADPALSRDDEAWPVKGRLIGKDGGKADNVSGMACTTQRGFPRDCLVVDDNLQDAQFVTLRDGKLVAGNTIHLIDDTFKRKPLELDGEGIAFSRGFYYVIGSHGHPRDSARQLDPVRHAAMIRARIAATSQIVRFRARKGTAATVERTSRLREAIAAEPGLAPFVDRRLDENGLTIEGIAIRNDTLFAGFRAPVLDNDRAAILSVPIDALFGRGDLKQRLFRLPLGPGRGVRDLASFGEGILILAGPAAAGSGPYAVYWWDGDGEQVRMLSELSQFAPKRKPEGLLPLGRQGEGLRVLILFDRDEEGTPTPVTIPAP